MGDGGYCGMRWSGGHLAGTGNLVLLPCEEKASDGDEMVPGASTYGKVRGRGSGEELEREGLEAAAGACEAGSVELLWRQRRPSSTSIRPLFSPGRLLLSPRQLFGSVVAQERPVPPTPHPPTRFRRVHPRFPSLQRPSQLVSLPHLLPNPLLRPLRSELPRGPELWQPRPTSPAPRPRNPSAFDPLRQRRTRLRSQLSAVGPVAPRNDARWARSHAE